VVTWPFYSPYAISYWWSFGTKPLSLTVSEIFNVECLSIVDMTLIRSLNKGQGHLFWYQSICCQEILRFRIVFHNNVHKVDFKEQFVILIEHIQNIFGSILRNCRSLLTIYKFQSALFIQYLQCKNLAFLQGKIFSLGALPLDPAGDTDARPKISPIITSLVFQKSRMSGQNTAYRRTMKLRKTCFLSTWTFDRYVARAV